MMAREWVSNEMSPSTVAPVVETPLIDSNRALTGFASVEVGAVASKTIGRPWAASRYGTAPIRLTNSHVAATIRNPSRAPMSGSGSSCSIPKPTRNVSTMLMAKTGASVP